MSAYSLFAISTKVEFFVEKAYNPKLGMSHDNLIVTFPAAGVTVKLIAAFFLGPGTVLIITSFNCSY